MDALRAGGWLDWIDQWVSSERPLMGVCLGMQLLFDGSEELGGDSGLGLIPGTVRALDSKGERLPHIGWSALSWTRPNQLSAGLEDEAAMYHVHSFVCEPASAEASLATAVHGEKFTTAATNGSNVFGVQFHPEKSSEDGLRLLSNFLRLARRDN
jgi:glutamine amidotransferase